MPRSSTSRRVFWVALPLAVVLALWMGPGLDSNDEMPMPTVDAQPVSESTPLPSTPECEPPPDAGPDGDR